MKRMMFLLFMVLLSGVSHAQCAFSASVTATTPSCYNTYGGSATFNITGGTPPYEVYVEGSIASASITSGGTVPGITAGIHHYYIQDLMGCSFEDTLVVPASNTLSVSASLYIADEQCPGLNNGQIYTDIVSPGAYTIYFGSSPLWYPDDTIKNLVPGNYTIEIMDAGTQCTSFVATVDPGTMANCGTLNGTVYFDENENCVMDAGDFPFPYAGGYVYVQAPGEIMVPVNTDGTYSIHLPLGTHTLNPYVSSPGICPPSAFTISMPGQIVTANTGQSLSNNTCGMTVTPVVTSNCGSYCMAAYTVNVTGGLAPYNYNYGGNDPNRTNVCSGNNIVVVTDANGCTEAVGLYIDSDSIPLTGATITPTITPSTCDINLPDGEINMNVTGPDGPYTFSWSAEEYEVANVYSSLVSGFYSVYISDNAGHCSPYYYTVPLNMSASCPGTGGKVYYDFNENCVFDAGDRLAYGIHVITHNTDTVIGINSVTDTMGNYLNNVPYGNYKVSLNISADFGLHYGDLDTACVGHYDVTLSATTPVANSLDFPLSDNNYCGAGVTYTLTPDCDQMGYKFMVQDSNVVIYPIGYSYTYPWMVYGFVNGPVFPPDTTVYFVVRNWLTECNEFMSITTGPVPSLASGLSFAVTDETCGLGYNGSIVMTDATGLTLDYLWSDGTTGSSLDNITAGYYTFNATDSVSVCFDTSFYIGTVDTACPKIVGRVFYDVNGNCIYDAGLDSLNASCYAPYVDINGNALAYVQPDGIFEYNCAPGTYTVDFSQLVCYDSTGAHFYQPCAHNILVSVDSLNPLSDTVEFALQEFTNPVVNLYCFGWGAVPGFEMGYNITLINNGTNTTGALFCVLDDSVSFVSATPMFDYTSGDTLFWNITAGYGTQHIAIQATVFPDPGLLGSTIDNSCGFIASDPEINTTDNYCSTSSIVVGAYDPNDKSVSPTGVGPAGFIKQSDSVLTYRINFQNTGTAPAHDVVVIDTLSPNLDLATLQVLETSHFYTLNIDGRVCKFTFPDIMLPDSNVNEPASHGHITYRIHLNEDLDEFTAIENTAYIYFDFNPAIVTNTTTSTINNFLSIEKQPGAEKSDPFRVYPNPFHDQLTIWCKDLDGEYSMLLTDISGKIIMEKSGLTHQQQFSVGDIGKGVYVLSLQNDQNVYTYRLIRQ